MDKDDFGAARMERRCPIKKNQLHSGGSLQYSTVYFTFTSMSLSPFQSLGLFFHRCSRCPAVLFSGEHAEDGRILNLIIYKNSL